MSGSNGYAALVKQRTSGKTKRRRLDDYETPNNVTRALVRHYLGPSFQRPIVKGPILEPACGSGRMVRELRTELECKVFGFDIKKGYDFFKRRGVWKGDTVTNPPYRDGLAERFVRHALKITNGRVCMLLQSGFLWGGKRGSGLYSECPPECVLILPERIYFYEDGRPIKSQFFNHAWVCWPTRMVRQRGEYDTKTIWVGPEDEDFVG